MIAEFAEHRTLPVDGGNVAYRCAGRARGRDRGHDRVLVLAHGFLGSSLSWAHVVERLSQTRRILAIDLPGHGATCLQPDPSYYSMGAASHALAQILTAENVSSFDLWGYSMGGRFALAHSLDSPHKPDRVVLESTSAGIENETLRATRCALDEERAVTLERDGIQAFVDSWETLPLFASQTHAAPALLAAQRRIRLATKPQGAASSLRAMGTGTTPSCLGQLATLGMPTLLICGSLDEKFRAAAGAMATELLNGQQVIIDEAGHNVHLERPDHIVEVVEAFLRNPIDPSSESGRRKS
ncbi:MAG: 2-succinyl-6-hydroxy-2,4-cyclohexadiene-1-carboxylate synthase [Planctomycetota bacterium]